MTAIAIYFQSPLLQSFPIFPINQKLPTLFPEPEKKYFPDVFLDRGNAGKSFDVVVLFRLLAIAEKIYGNHCAPWSVKNLINIHFLENGVLSVESLGDIH